MKKETYDDLFYKDMYENTKYAATKILSILNDLAVINSVVDLGCGIGAWLCCAKNVFSRGVRISVYADWMGLMFRLNIELFQNKNFIRLTYQNQ